MNLKDSFRMDPAEEMLHQNMGSAAPEENQQAGQASSTMISTPGRQRSLFDEELTKGSAV